MSSALFQRKGVGRTQANRVRMFRHAAALGVLAATLSGVGQTEASPLRLSLDSQAIAGMTPTRGTDPTSSRFETVPARDADPARVIALDDDSQPMQPLVQELRDTETAQDAALALHDETLHAARQGPEDVALENAQGTERQLGDFLPPPLPAMLPAALFDDVDRTAVDANIIAAIADIGPVELRERRAALEWLVLPLVIIAVAAVLEASRNAGRVGTRRRRYRQAA